MRTALVLSVLTIVAIAQETPARPANLPWPSRPLEWKDVNFISTSDTHGWLLGHQHATWPEPNYSGDFGSFASFVTHLRAMADEQGEDLILVDAGDHHDGSGLVSSSSASASRAEEIFSMLEYDVLTIGNHELYYYGIAKEIYDHRDRWKGRFLTSNVNITVQAEDGQSISVPVGERFAKFETKQGRKVTAFGLIFDFQWHDQNLTVQSPDHLVEESWFLDAIDIAPDFFVLVGHMPVRDDILSSPSSSLVDIRMFEIAYSSTSDPSLPGRYMETIAFTSSSLPDDVAPGDPLSVSRRYIDGNTRSYIFHSRRHEDNFNTPLGVNITWALLSLASKLDISKPLGRAPHDLFLSRYAYGHPRSILTEWTQKVIPTTVQDPARQGARLLIAQAGSLRFDVFQGGFDRNDELTVSPFENHFLYIPLQASLARKVTDQLNLAGPSKLHAKASSSRNEDERVERIYREWLSSQWEYHVGEESKREAQVIWFKAPPVLTMGYVTRDTCPGIGDDIEHIPVPYSGLQPAFVCTPFPSEVGDDEKIDVGILSFSLDDFLAAVNTLDPELQISAQDVKPYAEHVAVNNMWGKYATMAWQD
ncbi:MAG: hypothetical protein TREMPRED_003238 [Tremellales sp. Tagirdzhanova-0007]|nr:MAG: hypothetical protein TREMPRED_003238 [Tremellales sp. Tagirdzhanova-0007]